MDACGHECNDAEIGLGELYSELLTVIAIYRVFR